MGSRTKCFDCGAGRGLAEYEDGTFCHACHTKTKSRSLIKQEKAVKKELKVPMWDGTDQEWPREAFNWLIKYADNGQLTFDKVFWSDEYKRIVFPSPCGKAAWMRSVNEQPKWLFVGDKDAVFCYEKYPRNLPNCPIEVYQSNAICLVEDVVSAIKVSEVMDSMALGGTVLKDNIYSYIGNNGYQKVYIFLDGDGAGRKGAEQIRKKLALLCDTVIIRSNRDPKEHMIDEIKELLK